MEVEELKSAVLAHVTSPNYRPVKPRVIAKKLELSVDDTRLVRKVVKELVREGRVAYGASHLVKPVTPPAAGSVPPRQARELPHDQITGLFRRALGGFGFVRPRLTDPTRKMEDIFIPAQSTLDAASGDLVLIRIRPSRRRGKPGYEGEILEIVERDTHQFVGTYFERAGSGYVQVDGTSFSQPIFVGDAGAKNARDDDKVVFEMVRFPSARHDGEGVITEVLGPRGTPGVDTLTIIREYGFPVEFPEDARDEARDCADQFDESIGEGRTDLTGEVVLTIDPVDARDFDDAISLERIENDHWRLGVHIADVTHFVRHGTSLDREAHLRATSVYLPDRVLPMLPEVISNALASLQPDKVRYTVTAFIEFTPEGSFVALDLHKAAIRSRRRFTYEEVDEYLANPQKWEQKLVPEVHALLGRMRDLARILRARRRARGSLELHMPEIKVDLGREGHVVGAHLEQDTESHQIIEEFMLSANEAVARWLFEREVPFLRRVHLPPDPRKSKALTEFVADLGIQTGSLEDRFELQKLLDEVRDLPESRAVNFAVLKSLQRAVYSPEEEGHFALASDCYCHFTSPIRRYPDLTVHRQIETLLAGKKPAATFAEQVVLGQHCSDNERKAEDAERELTKIKLLAYLSERVGDRLPAVITGVEEFGLFVQGIELPAEGLVHISTLADDYYHYERRSHTLTGRRAGNVFRLGDLVTAEVARVDVDRRELDFRIVGRPRHPARHTLGAKADKPHKPKRDKGKAKAKSGKGKNKGKGKSKGRGKRR